MKRKFVLISLVAAATLLVCASLILTILSASGKSIIGGADLPTLTFVFFRESGGVYFLLALLGVFCFLTACVIGMKKK